uniref:Uncharacterized protein n=1 Tax=Knipowitschia caucasica TaxID=637954 RepID=A0AAV2KZ21_KNICA
MRAGPLHLFAAGGQEGLGGSRGGLGGSLAVVGAARTVPPDTVGWAPSPEPGRPPWPLAVVGLLLGWVSVTALSGRTHTDTNDERRAQAPHAELAPNICSRIHLTSDLCLWTRRPPLLRVAASPQRAPRQNIRLIQTQTNAGADKPCLGRDGWVFGAWRVVGGGTHAGQAEARRGSLSDVRCCSDEEETAPSTNKDTDRSSVRRLRRLVHTVYLPSLYEVQDNCKDWTQTSDTSGTGPRPKRHQGLDSDLKDIRDWTQTSDTSGTGPRPQRPQGLDPDLRHIRDWTQTSETSGTGPRPQRHQGLDPDPRHKRDWTQTSETSGT